MLTRSRDDLADAQRAVADAETALADAQAGLVAARDQLDRAFGARGWRRLAVVGGPDQDPVYVNRLHPDALLHRGDVLEILELTAKGKP